MGFQGVNVQGLSPISDNRSQPAATCFMKEMASLEIQQISISCNNPGGNADTKGMIRTVKKKSSGSMNFQALLEVRERL